jgi:hypothetical protein
VRLTLIRGTVHLVTVSDALALRPLVQPVVERAHSGAFGRRMGDIEPAELRAAVRDLLVDGPLTARELGTVSSNAASAGTPRPPAAPPGCTCRSSSFRPAVSGLRYLGAFGPATVRDMQNWSGLTRLKAAFEDLRRRLVTFRDDQGRELFDLPDAPRPGPNIPAPVRFLGEYDNVLLGHADRRRIIPEDFPWKAMLAPGRFVGNVLVDGMLQATWWIEREGKRRATLGIRPFRKLSRSERDEVAAEARRMIDFAAADAERRDVRFERTVG